jgi:NitT/TauT family transport system substrate-binding protein
MPIVGITGGPVETDARKTHALLVLASSPITEPKALTGKTVAVNALRNIEHVMLRQYLEKNGIPVDSVKVVEAPFPQMEGVLKNGSVDAVMAIEPFITLAQNNKTVRVLGYPYTDVRTRSIVSAYDVRSDWLTQNADTARKFAAAIAEATDFINNNGTEARQILLKYTKIPQEVADKVVITEFQGKADAAELQVWIDELARQGIIEKAFPAQDAFKQP